MDPPTHSLQTLQLTSCSSLDESHSCIPELHIFLSSRLLSDNLNTVYMYGSFAICVKKSNHNLSINANQKMVIFNDKGF